MKNFDVKKLFVLILIVLVVAVGVFFIVKNLGGSKKPTEEEAENAENLSIEYYANLTRGYSSFYGGLEILYQNEKTTYEDLEPAAIIYSAINYATDNNIDLSINTNTLLELKEDGGYTDIDKYTVYKGEGIRNAVKELFGVDFKNQSADDSINFMYKFVYDSVYDVYLMSNSGVQDLTDRDRYIDYKIIETVKKKDKIITTIAIAYVYNNAGTIMYAKDPNGEEIIIEDAEKEEFPEDKVDEFNKYDITLKETEDNKFVFDSIELKK